MRFRNLFAPELESELPADLSSSRWAASPSARSRRLWPARGLEVHEAGDCLGPRGLEEAILEGTLAAQAVGARSSSR